jgi:hypothetical protein
LQIVQYRNAGLPCFLAESPWKALLQDREAPPVSELSALQLRSQLSEYLTDLPGLLDQAVHFVMLDRESNMNLSKKDVQAAWLLRQRMAAFDRSLVRWYDESLAVRFDASDIFGDGSYLSITQQLRVNPDTCPGGAARLHLLPRLALLPCVLHCVTNDVLAHLTKILLALDFLTEPRTTDWPQQLDEYQRRQAATVAAFRCVKAKSAVGTKMLSFGLQQLSFKSSSFDEIILRKVPTFCDLDIPRDAADGEPESDISACATM